jgi:hypothetical protein
MDDRLLDSSESSEKEKNYFTDFNFFIQNINNLAKQIRKQLIEFKNKTKDNSLTINLEKNIENDINKYINLVSELDTAYKDINVPPGFPQTTQRDRQREIQKLEIESKTMKEQLKLCKKEKYKFKGGINEDYNQKEEFKYMDSGQLEELEKEKLKNQDEQLEGITLEVKKNNVLAKNTREVLKDQNKKMEVINEDIDRTKERMNSVTGRFKTYVAKSSWCLIIFILIVELAIGLLAFFILGN